MLVLDIDENFFSSFFLINVIHFQMVEVVPNRLHSILINSYKVFSWNIFFPYKNIDVTVWDCTMDDTLSHDHNNDCFHLLVQCVVNIVLLMFMEHINHDFYDVLENSVPCDNVNYDILHNKYCRFRNFFFFFSFDFRLEVLVRNLYNYLILYRNEVVDDDSKYT